MKPILYIVIPCFNEQEVLLVTAPEFAAELGGLISDGLVSDKSRIMFVDDGSRDNTWQIISKLAAENSIFCGIKQSRNRGHQNALLAGLMDAKEVCDITVSVDCDGQDDISAIREMVKQYLNGCEVVYGVRSSRKTDSFFKRFTAQGFYKFMSLMGAETVYNHADYRLISSRVLNELETFKEVNLFLRGMVPLVGFKSTSVYYERSRRKAGKSHYPFRKMLSFAIDGITSFSIKPLRFITLLGFLFSFLSFVGIVWSVINRLMDNTNTGWASIMCAIFLIGGIQLICLGIIGEYIGKIYLEAKARPRYIISERTEEKAE